MAMVAVIFLLLAMIVFTGLHWASMPPSRLEVIDSTTLHQAGEFIQENLGTAVDPEGHVTVRVLAEQYAFRPHCLILPAGQPVTMRSTSSDVVHGLQIMGTNVNTMLVPGYVSTFTVTLANAGEHAMPCHEFCGVGHATMWAEVQVLPKAVFYRMAQSRARLSCD
jgi:cytochrome c oxidase subunit 2